MPTKQHHGISHRTIHLWLLIITVLFSGTIIALTYRLTDSFMRFSSTFRQTIELQNAAHELMNASDYLTEQVQRFTIDGDTRFLKQYFTEAFESKRREEALFRMHTDERATEALTHLQNAMDGSVKLMDLEYYAMRLVIEAKQITEYPDILAGITLRAEDQALSSSEKIRRATALVLSDEYYEQKDRIRENIAKSLDALDKMTKAAEANELLSLNQEIRFARTAVLVQALFVFFVMWLTTHLAINPILKAVDNIKEGSPIPETGSNEFRYLAGAYNKMYQKTLSSLEQLNFKASHDELTGVYNRAGYDHLITALDLKTTHLMVLDLDDFKGINDTYGHETGDKILIKLVHTLQHVFRDDDRICRIGGDEFAIFMVHSGEMQRKLIGDKLDKVNEELSNTEDGLPSASISVGIVNGKDVEDLSLLFEKADEALYHSKTYGKHTYSFYS